jgi:2-dehydro-3-deoxygluconokinase
MSAGRTDRGTAKVVTFGELMLRLSPRHNERLLQSPEFSAAFGGGEANVAVSLAHFGIDSWFATRLPAHAIGDAGLAALRAQGVRTEAIVRGGDRVGIYYAETGVSQRPSVVIYDRQHSSISEMPPDALDWSGLLRGAAWFHVTGITPALSPTAAACTVEALRHARAHGARISIDLNFRRKLWSESDAQAVMRRLVSNVDVVIANEEDLQACLGISVADAPVTEGRLDPDAYCAAARRVAEAYGVKLVAVTLRESYSASDNGWSAVAWHGDSEACHRSRRYDIRLVDRIGGGDAFSAGLIYGLVSGRTTAAALDFAVAASALKQTIPGDVNRVSVAEVDRLVSGDASGRVQR